MFCQVATKPCSILCWATVFCVQSFEFRHCSNCLLSLLASLLLKGWLFLFVACLFLKALQASYSFRSSLLLQTLGETQTVTCVPALHRHWPEIGTCSVGFAERIPFGAKRQSAPHVEGTTQTHWTQSSATVEGHCTQFFCLMCRTMTSLSASYGMFLVDVWKILFNLTLLLL